MVKIDGIVAAIMALDRAQRNEGQQAGSVCIDGIEKGGKTNGSQHFN